jgi:plasmid stabilization system protein ParE
VRIEIMPQARSDLAAIGDYIAVDDPDRARTFVEELFEASLSLEHHPERYALVPQYRDQGVRSQSYGSYVIFYRIKLDAVQVLRVVHGRRDLTHLLFD